MAISSEQRPLQADRILAQEAAEAAAAEFTIATGDGGYLNPDELPTMGGPLGRWHFKLATDAANAKAGGIVDSKSEARTAASSMWQRLGFLHTQAGEALAGLGAGDEIPDGIGDGTTTYKTAADRFTADDVGRAYIGQQVPQGTAIMAYVGPREVTLNNAVPAGAGLRGRVGRHLIAGGNNGRPLIDWWNLPGAAFPGMSYSVNRLVADAWDLGILNVLTNDIRTGLLGDTLADCVTNGRIRLGTIMDGLRDLSPGTDWLIETPATFLAANVGGLNYVTDSLGNINPAGQAQIYSKALRAIPLSFRGNWPNVEILDTQAQVFGTVSVNSSPLMVDQIHESVPSSSDLFNYVGSGGGYAARADALAAAIGFDRGAFPAAGYRTSLDLIVYSGGVGFVRCIARNGKIPAPRSLGFKADTLYINGKVTPYSLAAATINRAFSTEWIEFTGGALAGIDFTSYAGATALIAGDHAPVVVDHVPVFVDLPNIAAGASVTVQVDVPGVMYGSVGERVGVKPNPGWEFSIGVGVLRLTGWRIPAAGKVDLFITNPSGADVNENGELWDFELSW